MFERLFRDWKTYFALVLSAAAIGVTWWIYQSELDSKSLSIQLVSQLSLQSGAGESLPGIEFSLDGKKLAQPYLTVIQVTNDGKKPITTSDFETPLEMRLESKSNLIRTQITDKIPIQFEAKLSEWPTGFRLLPTLFNPGDSLKIAVITSGDVPSFKPFARIVGVSSIELKKVDVKKPGKLRLTMLVIATIFLLTSFWMIADGLVFKRGVFLRRRAALISALAAVLPGIIWQNQVLDAWGVGDGFERIWMAIPFLIVSLMLSSALNRKIEDKKI